MIGKDKPRTEKEAVISVQVPEERYAYYRRCQQFLRNGKQCKAPAMKGEAVCHQHAMQADARRRRERQREEMLAVRGTGFGSRQQICRTAIAMVEAVLNRRMEHKTAQQVVWDMQKAMAGIPNRLTTDNTDHTDSR